MKVEPHHLEERLMRTTPEGTVAPLWMRVDALRESLPSVSVVETHVSLCTFVGDRVHKINGRRRDTATGSDRSYHGRLP